MTTVDQEILDGVGAAAASYTDVSTGTSSLSGYTIVPGTAYTDEYTGGPNKGLQFVVYASTDHSQVIVSFVGTNEGKDAIGDLDLAWNQFSDSGNSSAIHDAIATALAANPDAEVTFAGHSAGGILAQYAAYDYEANIDTGHTQTVNLVTNNAPGATAVLAAQLEIDTSAIAAVASNFSYVANTFEQADIVHLMGSAYVGSTTTGAQTVEIQTPEVYDPVTGHLVSNSLYDLGEVNLSTDGYSLVETTPHNFGISDESAALTSTALAQDADVIPGLDGGSAYAYAFGQFLSIAGTLGANGQSDGVRELLDAYIEGKVNSILAQPGGPTFLESADANAEMFAVSKLESYATDCPDVLHVAGEAIKEAVIAGDYIGSPASEIGSGVTSALEDAYSAVMAAAAHAAFSLPDWITDALTPFNVSRTVVDPLVIDVSTSHTGITLTEFDASTTSTFFDMTGDGFAQQTAWTSGDTGFLVHDLNSNGKIDDITEMFGSSRGDGFSQLLALDSNHDLKIDSHDTDWSSLQVWVDSNGDGISQSSELHSLSSLGIVSIDLAGVTASSSTIDGNDVSHTSTVTFSDDSTATIADAWLTNDTVNTYYNGSYTLDSDTLFLPDLRGYGTLPDLAISMSQDSTLKGMVESFVSDFSTSGFAASLDSDAQSILYQWAGVEGVDPSSRGGNVDAQQLEFLEGLFGRVYDSNDGAPTPNPPAAASPLLQESWQLAFEQFKDDMILQDGGSSLFTNPVTYNPWTGTTSGDTSLSHTAIEALADNAPSDPGANAAYWNEVGHFVDSIKGLDNVTSTEATWLDDTIYSTNHDLSWDDVINAIGGVVPTNTIDGTSGNDTIIGTDAADTIQGYAGNDVIHGGAGNDTIYGDSESYLGSDGKTLYGDAGSDILYGALGNDSLYGGDGNDSLYGYDGNDILSGGAGGNHLYGGAGDDTYIYTAGADDFINEQGQGGSDQIVLPSGITIDDLTFTRVDDPGDGGTFTDLLITINGGGSIQIHNQLDTSSYQVETLVFSDSSTFDLTSLSDLTVYLTTGDDDITNGMLPSVNNTVYGLDGNDIIWTGSGNDILDGGPGNDQLHGGMGDDTYIASPGFDSISDSGGTDTIVIPASYTSSDVVFYRGGGHDLNDLIIDIKGLGEIDVVGQFSSTSNAVEHLHFLSDDSTVSLTDQSILTVGTDGSDYLTAPTIDSSANAIIYGYGGNDTIYGGDGNDTLIGGAGNDVIHGGAGDDTFVYAPGWGSDIVVENTSEGTDTIKITGLDPADIRMWTDYTGALHLENTLNTADNITINAGTTGSETYESTVGQHVEQVTFDDSTTWDLTGGLALQADNSGDYLYGTAYGDTITGGTGSDYIYGNGGNDIIIGGAGNDHLYGGTGDDTYVFTSGFGNAVIHENLSEGNDTIHFSGIDPSNIHMWTDSYGTLYLQDTSDPSHSITVQAGTTAYYSTESTVGEYVEQVTFDSSYATTWDLTGGLHITGDDSGDTLYGTAYADTITGGSGSDYIYGNGGNDIIIGGAGNDHLYGGTGDDTYVFTSGFGNAVIHENLSEGNDTIHFSGIDPSNIHMWTDSYGTLYLQDTSDPSHSITVQAGTTAYYSTESTVGEYVEQVTFDSSYATTWDLTGGLHITGDDSGDTLYGTAYADTITGGSGSDYIYGNGGDDTLIGGAGNNHLDGGTGTNTVDYSHASAAVAVDLSSGSTSDNGEGGSDTLANIQNVTGSAYDDTITGDSNDNILYGAGGNDMLTGGDGADCFVFKGATVFTGSATIADFNTSQGDKIDISDVLHNHYNPLTDAIADFVQLTTSGSNTLLKVDLDGTGTTYSPTTIATIQGITGLDLATLISDHHLIIPT
jgi:Ca2+-binding RTX toxin-like protein